VCLLVDGAVTQEHTAIQPRGGDRVAKPHSLGGHLADENGGEDKPLRGSNGAAQPARANTQVRHRIVVGKRAYMTPCFMSCNENTRGRQVGLGCPGGEGGCTCTPATVSVYLRCHRAATP